MGARRPTPSAGPLAAAAYLRVYEPFEGFRHHSVRRREALRAAFLAASGAGALDRLAAAAGEHAAALRALSALPPRSLTELDLAAGAQAPDDGSGGEPVRALILEPGAVDGEPRVCPLDLRWRSLLAIDELRHQVPTAVLSAFLPPLVLAEAERELAELSRREHHGGAPHVRTSGWHVPIPWFALFRPDHRVATDRGAAGGQPPAPGSSAQLREAPLQVRYCAPMADARRNLARALSAARRARIASFGSGELEQIGKWLEEFHARSVVELDYAGLLTVITQDLLSDDSVEIVSRCITRLRTARDDDTLAELSHLRRRWDAVRALEHAS